jgi:uncharacterized protein YjiS (DUF1127 family)
MPIQPTNLTSETEQKTALFGIDLSLTPVKEAMNDALAAASPDASIPVPGNALSERDAAGPAAVSMQSVFGLLKRYWLAFQEWRQRERLRGSLQHLSERELMDIGIAPGEIEYIVAHRAIDRLRECRTHSWMSRGVM